jgi:hypothetical protein
VLNSLSVLVCSYTTFIIKPVHPPENRTIIRSPTETRKAAKPALACGLVATKRPNRVGERAGNAQEAEPRQNLKRGAGGARRRPTTEQRSRGCVPLGWGAHIHQAALNNSKTEKSGRRTCLARALHRGSKNKSGNWGCRMFVVRWMHVVGRSLLAYSRSKKSPTEKLHCGPSLHQSKIVVD